MIESEELIGVKYFEHRGACIDAGTDINDIKSKLKLELIDYNGCVQLRAYLPIGLIVWDGQRFLLTGNENLFGIPITREWIESAEQHFFWDTEGYKFALFLLPNTEEKLEVFFWTTTPLVLTDEFQYIRLQYVHELQMFYHVMSNHQELKFVKPFEVYAAQHTK